MKPEIHSKTLCLLMKIDYGFSNVWWIDETQEKLLVRLQGRLAGGRDGDEMGSRWKQPRVCHEVISTTLKFSTFKH